MIRYFLMTLLTILILAGCVPDSDNPLTDPNKEPIDPSILGTWFWADGNETGYIHIGLDEKSKLLKLIMVDFDKDKELEASKFSGHTTSLEGNNYLNLKWVHPLQPDTKGYLCVKYIASSDSLGISLMDSEVVEKAIQNGSLKGNIVKEKWSTSVHITEDQKKLQKFIHLKDKELFPEMNYLQKLKLKN
ncbi:MAG: hypothetical protein IE885_04780 [Campylobacterales bacterium]|nr:hypothetical protein [Campylobacterales bacterium]